MDVRFQFFFKNAPHLTKESESNPQLLLTTITPIFVIKFITIGLEALIGIFIPFEVKKC